MSTYDKHTSFPPEQQQDASFLSPQTDWPRLNQADKTRPWMQHLSAERLRIVNDNSKIPFEGSGPLRLRFEMTAKS